MPENRPSESAPETGLYTPEQRRLRDESPWTIVQGGLAPLQFLIFLVSLILVLRYLVTGNGLYAANASVIMKTIALLTIMVTGSIWEKEVFGVWLFAKPFFWEDVFSFLVIALHLWYVVALFQGHTAPRTLMYIALAAYAAYVINAVQFILKLRAARLQEQAMKARAAAPAPAAAPAGRPQEALA